MHFVINLIIKNGNLNSENKLADLWEFVPGNLKKPHFAVPESCCRWDSASGTLCIG
jgi:hypothetical protein